MNQEALDQLKQDHLKSMQDWAKDHIETILRELKQANILLSPENIEAIIQETNYEIRSRKHPTACEIYKPESKSCHEGIEQLNCFLCACPNYQYEEAGSCKIEPSQGHFYENPNIINGLGKVWDCNGCTLPHTQSFLRDYLEENIDKLRELSDRL